MASQVTRAATAETKLTNFGLVKTPATIRVDLESEPEAVSAKLGNVLPGLLDRATIAAQAAAEALGLSERTLHRRLAQEGTSYLALLDRARFERASQLMALPEVSLEEIALACGFLENSGFYRAFKRWTGKAPREYRKREGLKDQGTKGQRD